MLTVTVNQLFGSMNRIGTSFSNQYFDFSSSETNEKLNLCQQIWNYGVKKSPLDKYFIRSKAKYLVIILT
jgi:hypothetical protein